MTDAELVRLNPADAVTFARTHGGWAATEPAAAGRWACLPDDPASAWASPRPGGWPTADLTWWEPPDPGAFDPDLADHAITETDDLDPLAPADPLWQSPWRCTTWEIDPDHAVGPLAAVTDAALAAGMIANASWWRLDLTHWALRIKRYDPGEAHPTHQDLHCGHLTRKLGVSVELSDPDDYTGGRLRLYSTLKHGVAIDAPRTRGTVVVFPGWVDHEVTPVVDGERWSLVAWGMGPPIR